MERDYQKTIWIILIYGSRALSTKNLYLTDPLISTFPALRKRWYDFDTPVLKIIYRLSEDLLCF